MKSAVARELLKHRSSERHVPLVVTSRGFTPEEHIPEDLRARLMAEGIDPRAQPLRKLRQSDLNAADMVILFDPLPPDLRVSQGRVWSAGPSVTAHYPDTRADPDRRIDALLDQPVR